MTKATKSLSGIQMNKISKFSEFPIIPPLFIKSFSLICTASEGIGRIGTNNFNQNTNNEGNN